MQPGCTLRAHLLVASWHFISGQGKPESYLQIGMTLFSINEVACYVCTDTTGSFGCKVILDFTASFQLVHPNDIAGGSGSSSGTVVERWK